MKKRKPSRGTKLLKAIIYPAATFIMGTKDRLTCPKDAHCDACPKYKPGPCCTLYYEILPIIVLRRSNKGQKRCLEARYMCDDLLPLLFCSYALGFIIWFFVPMFVSCLTPDITLSGFVYSVLEAFTLQFGIGYTAHVRRAYRNQ